MAGRKQFWPDYSFSDDEGAIPPPLRTLNTPVRGTSGVFHTPAPRTSMPRLTPGPLVFSPEAIVPPSPRAPLPSPNFPAGFLNTPVRGASPAGVFGSAALRPPMPRPPPGARPRLSFSPVLPQNRGPSAIQPEIGSLLAEIQRLKVGYAEDLRTRDKENHYLRCQLGVSGADNLETFNKLMDNDIAEHRRLRSIYLSSHP